MRIKPTAVIGAVAATALLSAGTVSGTVRPQSRPLATAEGGTAAPARSVAPEARPVAAGDDMSTPPAPVPFDDWLEGFRLRAAAAGISEEMLTRALSGIAPDPEVIVRDRNQFEFTKTIWTYLDTAVSEARIRNGRAALDRNRALLERIEAKWGVDKEIIVAIWGLESAYGGFRGTHSVLRSLATLAHDTRRSAFFEEQLLEALRILDNGDTTLANLRGSWAGAMGHTQFMPTSWRDFAVDFDGDGRRDIWADAPADALASTAAYLKHHGWTHEQPWGVEVSIPDGFDWTLADRAIRKMPSDWAALGIVAPDGRAVPDHGPASILLPGGHKGAAFMIFDNFAVLEAYNTADAYVVGVGQLANRISGGAPIGAGWPREDRALSFDERKEVQRRLTASGFDTEKIDGRIGPLTIDAARAYQVARGLVPDGYVSPGLLAHLRNGG